MGDADRDGDGTMSKDRVLGFHVDPFFSGLGFGVKVIYCRVRKAGSCGVGLEVSVLNILPAPNPESPKLLITRQP